MKVRLVGWVMAATFMLCISQAHAQLEWQSKEDLPKERMTWEEANQHCADLIYNEKDDWRLPEPDEFVDLFKLDGTVIIPAGNALRSWWGAEFAGDTEKAWLGRHNWELLDRKSKTAPGPVQVRCVRGEIGHSPLPPKLRFERIEPGIVNDYELNVQWQRRTAAKERDQVQAARYCKRLVLGGHDDWRLPHAKELLSLVDLRTLTPLTRLLLTPPTDHWAWYWYQTDTIVTHEQSQRKGFIIIGNNGRMGENIKGYESETIVVRCVRDMTE